MILMSLVRCLDVLNQLFLGVRGKYGIVGHSMGRGFGQGVIGFFVRSI
jgi:hypothetical protein